MSMPYMLTSSSVALVTASSAGLGAATARALARNGVRVVINYLSSKEKADKLLEDLNGLQPETGSRDADRVPQFLAIKADVSQRAELSRLIDETIDVMGRLDLVVSNQGWTKMRNFQDLDDNVEESDWDTCFNMNVKSHLFLFHAARKHLEASGGSFITTASLAGVKPSGSSVAYSVTKAIHLVKSLALIAGPVRVNSVSPGILLTDWGLQFPASKVEAAIGKSPLKRIATVEDVAQQILFLANSASTTGANSVLDAGLSL
ncbi:related to cis-1,2-dihydro-1,2-dihydroxynaphthalene dehydrogenase [Phialocephala subalpina]|uniref:Related to cis-1,2-dihydro-1,2-dihydroxynaphthalene dehydrogenase n=1 Tax=Phialocephala subalpina TaxID=576137 RepID=A0A1L7WJK3_9HELO|nr:related to cis-1,2-dihydro-1,2-dihydroxynaphthalene dehydrogenase [Phialocephala subalpina]